MQLSEIREELDTLGQQLLTLLQRRQELAREVARQKKVSDSVIHAPTREAQIIQRTTDQCVELGLNSDFVLEIVSLMIAHAKDAQCDVLGVDTFMDMRPQKKEDLRSNLLRLTEVVAGKYDRENWHHTQRDAISFHLAHERELLESAMSAVEEKDVVVDLGCAVGNVCELLEGDFESVCGVDLSSHMLSVAVNRRQWGGNVSFQEHDLSSSIPFTDGALSFAVANFGTASEISPSYFPELHRVLKPGGTALLSFYNKDALSTLWYYPWPTTLRSHLNTYNDTLEVWEGDAVYVIEAEGMTVETLQSRAQAHGFAVEWVESFPTYLSVLPRFFFSSPRFAKLVGAVEELDRVLSKQAPYRGTFLTALLRKN